MLSPRFQLYLVGLIVILVGTGLFIYQNQIKFQEFMDTHVHQMAWLNNETSLIIPDASDSTDDTKSKWQTFDKDQWKTYWSYQKPTKVKDSQQGTDEDVKVIDNLEIAISDDELVPQMVETPDGRIHQMYWYSKLQSGQEIPPAEEWPMSKVIIDGMMYNVPPGETSDSFIDKIRLATIYDIPLDSVAELIDEGIIPSSPLEVKNDPLFDDPIFARSRREDSRPVESSISWNPTEWGVSEEELKMMTEGIPVTTETRMINGKMMVVEVETGWVVGPSDDSGELAISDNEGAISSPIKDSDDSIGDEFEKHDHSHDTILFDEWLPPPAPEAELSESVLSNRLGKTEAGINLYNTKERLHRLQELWEPDPPVVPSNDPPSQF